MNRPKPLVTEKSRRQQIIDFRLRNPCLTLESIGHQFGISRERVRQVLAKAKVATSHRSVPPIQYRCQNQDCGQTFNLVGSQLTRYHQTGQEPMYCSLECQKANNRITVLCSYCSKEKKARKSEVLRSSKDSRYKGNFFCNKRCQGLWLAQEYGFGTPGNTAMTSPNRHIRTATHFACGHELIPENTISYPSLKHSLCRTCERLRHERRYERRTDRPKYIRGTSTACYRGHLRTPETTYEYHNLKTGVLQRHCRLCDNLNHQKHYDPAKQRQKYLRKKLKTEISSGDIRKGGK